MKYRVQVEILPRRGILDPQGRAVADALRTLGFADVEEVHLGRYLVVELAAASADVARASVTAMCERLLANPVTEQFVVGAAEPA